MEIFVGCSEDIFKKPVIRSSAVETAKRDKFSLTVGVIAAEEEDSAVAKG